ncbi:hypothetical protein [Corynebacterium sp.]|uniref:hypothetical protein n=1 Tax=Corynebacterium sp. TaxID=1720 RepID=UPI002A91C44F|nr:hypothetical protein [Corynebacterium sp.]
MSPTRNEATVKRTLTALSAAATSILLAACANTNQQNPTTTETSTSVVETTRQETSSAADTANTDDGQAAQAAPVAGGELASAVTGYTDEARRGMADEGVTEAEIEQVLADALSNAPGVKIDWSDNGYHEIESGEIEIDIQPDGTVVDVDR